MVNDYEGEMGYWEHPRDSIFKTLLRDKKHLDETFVLTCKHKAQLDITWKYEHVDFTPGIT